MQWIGGATCILTIGDVQIAVDPVLCPKGTVQDYFWFKSERIEEPVYQVSDFESVDLWLLTHDHEDHLDDAGLSVIDDHTAIISNKNAAKKLESRHRSNLTILRHHETTVMHINGYRVEIEAIPAIHGVNPLSALFAGKVNGYLITVSKDDESTIVYLTSDTVYKRSVIKSIDSRPIDLLIANMGAAKAGSWIMTLTLNSRMLKQMIEDLKPKRVVPIHFGTFEHYREPIDEIKLLKDERIQFLALGKVEKIN